MKELIRDDWNYTLYEQEQGLLLSVVCGTVAIFEVNVLLNEDEIKHFQKDGKDFLQLLADTIRSNPDEYFQRKV